MPLWTTIEIRPRDSSFAKTCPQRVQLDVLQPCEPLPDPPFLQMLYRAGNEHEDDTFALLFDGVEGAVVIEAEDSSDREWQTLQAVKDGALVIAGARLPIDHEAQRVGQPDLLVRHGEGYLPIEVKSHKALERSPQGRERCRPRLRRHDAVLRRRGGGRGAQPAQAPR